MKKRLKINKLTLIMTCGYPGSGKSTWIQNNIKELNNTAIVSLDEIRNEIFGNQFFYNSESFVIAIGEAMTRLLLKQGMNVIIDSTAPTTHIRRKWQSLAEEYDACHKIVWIKTPLDECKRRDSEREIPVGEDVIDKFKYIFQKPIKEEVFDKKNDFIVLENEVEDFD